MIKAMLSNEAVHLPPSACPTILAEAGRRRPSLIPDLTMIDGPGGMMSATPELKKLTAADAAAYQALRLEGLLRHPCEFGAAFEEEADLSLEEVGRRLDEGWIFGAFVEGELLAIAGYRRSDRLKKRHKAELFGVYVGTNGRRRGLGEAVVREVIAKAASEVEQLLATVATANLPAKSLYEKLGFVTFGHEPRAHKVDDRYFDQDHMVLMLV